MNMAFKFFLAGAILVSFQTATASEVVFDAKKNAALENQYFETISATNGCFEFALKHNINSIDVLIYELDEQFQAKKNVLSGGVISSERSISPQTTNRVIRVPMLRKVWLGIDTGGVTLRPVIHDKKRGIVKFELIFGGLGGYELYDPRWEIFRERKRWIREFPEREVLGTEIVDIQQNK